MSEKNTANIDEQAECIDLEQPQTSSSANQANPATVQNGTLNFLNNAMKKAYEAQELLNKALQQLHANLDELEQSRTVPPKQSTKTQQDVHGASVQNEPNTAQADDASATSSSDSGSDSDCEILAVLELEPAKRKKTGKECRRKSGCPARERRINCSRSRTRAHILGHIRKHLHLRSHGRARCHFRRHPHHGIRVPNWHGFHHAHRFPLC